MLTKTILPAIVAFHIGLSAADVCSDDEVSINSSADAEALSSCDTIEGTVTIGTQASGEISIDGPDSIDGDLICEDNGALTTLSSSSLTSIGGSFTMRNVTALTTLTMSKLSSVTTLDWQTLARLETVTFADEGLTEADTIRISDTFLSTLNAFSVTSPKKMEIDNNRRLTEWDSGLETLSDELVITANGFGLQVSFPDLVWIANMTISNVSDITVPSLEVVNGSMRFDSNFFTDFSAPNMTNTQDGDISFTGNSGLANVSFPLLTTVAGGFTIANNTKLEAIDGFPELKTIGGAVKLRGNFTTVELPSVNDVKGAFDISSTSNIDDVCSEFEDLSSSGGSGKIQGTFTCSSNNENANDVNSDGSSSGGDGDDESSSVVFGFSLPVAFSIAALGCLAQAVM
ncbi:GPI-anchored cell wall organization protein ecm33 [Zalerion maritima]|uniref:GPI-anchored cell wall organization protein ecm33 n=1 Tax=Zalerion maritima TaxID=339359 RepID=A0AAD5WUB4_9PEZI|nr:GPI-anchored cell wall organization protein ecm33 [Zalerion maritima]